MFIISNLEDNRSDFNKKTISDFNKITFFFKFQASAEPNEKHFDFFVF